MSVKIITDSTSDLPKGLAEELGITMVPLKVLFGEEVYKDGVEITTKEFYAKMAASKGLPTTAQVNPGEFIEEFRKHIEKGDEIVGIFISSKLSGTYNSAVMAREALNKGKISLIDSLNATFGLGLLVIEAARMAKEGKSAEEITERLEDLKNRIYFYGIIDNLENLKKGGRLSSTSALAGNLLGIKPIITLKDGAVAVIGKTRGQKKAFAWVMDDLKKNNIDLTDKTIGLAHANSPEALTEFKKMLLEEYSVNEIIEFEIGSVIGTHTGEGCIGLSFIS